MPCSRVSSPLQIAPAPPVGRLLKKGGLPPLTPDFRGCRKMHSSGAIQRVQSGFRSGVFLQRPVRIGPMEELTPVIRRALKAEAHALKPVVMIGNDGLTPAVLAEVERALKSHEPIKIRVLGDDREVRANWLREMCEHTGAAPVQHIGKILVIHRANPEPPPVAERRPRNPTRPEASPRTQPSKRWRGVASTRGAPPSTGWAPRPKRKTPGENRAAQPRQRPTTRKDFSQSGRPRAVAKSTRRRPN